MAGDRFHSDHSGLERRLQTDLLRDVFGNPFRRARVDPAWLAWNDGTVVKIAQSIYTERRFEDMPILGDALEDAGCSDAEILGHLRGREAQRVQRVAAEVDLRGIVEAVAVRVREERVGAVGEIYPRSTTRQ